ncbi:uncharacterized protein LOC114248078 [Bombyx mandarina]|uniref:Uncharacterized protein LOC114248078 n=1 Tax=Bombyx mandarina TaxID=7092 RepID=A0A6J2K4X1_BOMMA|nr:uncharacterized protein LOC114248078 [Bombyx mandarina]
MICLSEPVSEDSEEELDVLRLNHDLKKHPDNIPFMVPSTSAQSDEISETDDEAVTTKKSRLEKINSLNHHSVDERSNVLPNCVYDFTSQEKCNVNVPYKKRLRNNNTGKDIFYNEKSDDDGDFSATDESDYASDKDGTTTRKIKRLIGKGALKTTLIHRETSPSKDAPAPVLVPETPEASFDEVSVSTGLFVAESPETSDEEVEFSSLSASASKRKWDRRNCCIFCEQLVTNFTRHLFRNHSDEIDVQKLLSITDPDPKVQKIKRIAVTNDLRNRGNYLHNNNVVTDNEGCIIPNRRKNYKELPQSPSGYVVCKKCLGTFKRSTFYRHSKKCMTEDNMKKDMNRVITSHSFSIMPNFLNNISTEFKENILPKLRNDELALIVKNDPLIIAYGCRLHKKKKERRSRKSICSKMRDLASLLKVVREKHPEIAQLRDMIDPKYYEYFIEGVKILSGFDEKTGYVNVVSMPARIRPEILGCIEIMFTNTIMDPHKSTAYKDFIKNKLSEFKVLLESNWQWEISSNAEKTRKRKLMTKSQVMPLEKDIEKLTMKIHELEIKYYNDLKKDISIINYENLCEVTIAHIILLDRKRSGDVAEAELQYYLNRKTEEIPPQVLEMLDEDQKKAITDLDIFQIPGKRVRSVPVLLTKTMSKNIDLIISCRSSCNISPNNVYLFARPLTEEPFNGGRCLNRIKSMCNLKKPEMVTATGLRHHIATVSQVHAKQNDKFTEHLATFLGHDMHVHASNYRLPLQAIQKGLVGSKLLEFENLTNLKMTGQNKKINSNNEKQTRNEKDTEKINENDEEEKRRIEEKEKINQNDEEQQRREEEKGKINESDEEQRIENKKINENNEEQGRSEDVV